ncbi:MAG: hypothetical protein P0S95_00150 [Rhabdochlamydiaceae bacterium]|nr:hypothetical protein [Candidatus Amphrikana amoebophyrae]
MFSNNPILASAASAASTTATPASAFGIQFVPKEANSRERMDNCTSVLEQPYPTESIELADMKGRLKCLTGCSCESLDVSMVSPMGPSPQSVVDGKESSITSKPKADSELALKEALARIKLEKFTLQNQLDEHDFRVIVEIEDERITGVALKVWGLISHFNRFKSFKFNIITAELKVSLGMKSVRSMELYYHRLTPDLKVAATFDQVRHILTQHGGVVEKDSSAVVFAA